MGDATSAMTGIIGSVSESTLSRQKIRTGSVPVAWPRNRACFLTQGRDLSTRKENSHLNVYCCDISRTVAKLRFFLSRLVESRGRWRGPVLYVVVVSAKLLNTDIYVITS